MKMKKRIFTVLIILVCLFSCLFTCKPYDAEEAEKIEYTNVVYSPDENSITIYLYGQVPVPRSLTPSIAKMGCDYFEVTFLYNPDGDPDNYIVSRGSWMAGKVASVSGITRGVDYGSVSGTPTTGSGSAILFAGKSDKTLMAIGRLSAVNNGSGAVPETTITASTKSVTFTLAAITAAVKAVSGVSPSGYLATGSSFVTASGNPPLYQNANTANTIVTLKKLFATESAKEFPLFKLIQEATIKAIYTFDLASGGNANYAFNAYSNGIFISNPSDFGGIIPGLPLPVPPPPDYKIERKIPRYTTYNAAGAPIDTYHESILMLDEKTIITLDNNNTADTPFIPAVEFSLNTASTVSGTVFSLVFSIPVYALREFDGSGNRSRWYIRSSYGPSLYDLDDGTSGMGGAVLLGTGEVEKSVRDYTIRISVLPDKWQYTATDRVLDIDGLVVELITTDDVPIVIEKINYNDLIFKIEKFSKKAKWTGRDNTPTVDYSYTRPASTSTPAPYSFPADFYGIIEVTVEYKDPAAKEPYSASFYILVTNASPPSPPLTESIGANANSITTTNIAHIYDNTYVGNPSRPSNHTPWNTYPGSSGGAGTASERFKSVFDAGTDNSTTIIILHHSFIFSDTPNLNGKRIFIIIAADDDGNPNNNTNNQITMSKTNAAHVTHQLANAGLNAYYFGAWPFKTPPNGITTTNFPAVTKTFTVDCRGTASPPSYTGVWKILTDNTPGSTAPGNGGVYNVNVGTGMNIIPKTETPLFGGKPGETVFTYPLLH